jgi:hypothetical protein
VKMLLYDVVHMPVWVSLVVIAVVAGGAIGASVWRDRRQRRVSGRGPGQEEPGEPHSMAEPRAVGELHPVGEPHRVGEPRGPVRT